MPRPVNYQLMPGLNIASIPTGYGAARAGGSFQAVDTGNPLTKLIGGLIQTIGMGYQAQSDRMQMDMNLENHKRTLQNRADRDKDRLKAEEEEAERSLMADVMMQAAKKLSEGPNDPLVQQEAAGIFSQAVAGNPSFSTEMKLRLTEEANQLTGRSQFRSEAIQNDLRIKQEREEYQRRKEEEDTLHSLLNQATQMLVQDPRNPEIQKQTAGFLLDAINPNFSSGIKAQLSENALRLLSTADSASEQHNREADRATILKVQDMIDSVATNLFSDPEATRDSLRSIPAGQRLEYIRASLIEAFEAEHQDIADILSSTELPEARYHLNDVAARYTQQANTILANEEVLKAQRNNILKSEAAVKDWIQSTKPVEEVMAAIAEFLPNENEAALDSLWSGIIGRSINAAVYNGSMPDLKALENLSEKIPEMPDGIKGAVADELNQAYAQAGVRTASTISTTMNSTGLFEAFAPRNDGMSLADDIYYGYIANLNLDLPVIDGTIPFDAVTFDTTTPEGRFAKELQSTYMRDKEVVMQELKARNTVSTRVSHAASVVAGRGSASVVVSESMSPLEAAQDGSTWLEWAPEVMKSLFSKAEKAVDDQVFGVILQNLTKQIQEGKTITDPDFNVWQLGQITGRMYFGEIGGMKKIAGELLNNLSADSPEWQFKAVAGMLSQTGGSGSSRTKALLNDISDKSMKYAIMEMSDIYSSLNPELMGAANTPDATPQEPKNIFMAKMEEYAGVVASSTIVSSKSRAMQIDTPVFRTKAAIAAGLDKPTEFTRYDETTAMLFNKYIAAYANYTPESSLSSKSVKQILNIMAGDGIKLAASPTGVLFHYMDPQNVAPKSLGLDTEKLFSLKTENKGVLKYLTDRYDLEGKNLKEIVVKTATRKANTSLGDLTAYTQVGVHLTPDLAMQQIKAGTTKLMIMETPATYSDLYVVDENNELRGLPLYIQYQTGNGTETAVMPVYDNNGRPVHINAGELSRYLKEDEEQRQAMPMLVPMYSQYRMPLI